MFNEYPYTDLHNLNLDWFLDQFKKIGKHIEDLKKMVLRAPDATNANAGQAPIADGQGGWAWGDVATSGDSVPTEVRQAVYTLLSAAAYTQTGLVPTLDVVEAWASTVTDITVSPTTASISGSATKQLTAVTSPTGGAVLWSSSNTAVATVSSSGLVTGVGNGSCTITATSGSVSATCTVTVSGFATLTGISAVYTQSGTVYDTDTLDSLRSDLAVTASYDDSTTRTITDYTLSGTLTEGTCTITVSYGGYTDTFSVSVTARKVFIYHFDNSLQSSGNSDMGLSASTESYDTGHFSNAVKVSSLANIPYAVNISSDDLPVFDRDFTISVWAKLTAFSVSTIFRMAEYQDTTTIDNYLNSNAPTFYNGYNWAVAGTQTNTIQRRYVGYSLSMTKPTQITGFCPYLTIYSADSGQTKRASIDVYNSTYPILVDEWHHYAITRKDGVVMLFIDGLKTASFAFEDDLYVPSVANIGGAWSDATTPSYQNGSAPVIDELYINDGVCLYDSDFSVPTEPYTV